MQPTPSLQRSLETGLLFFKLGAISFGGPAAHVALMEQEVVRKLGWLEREHFLDLLAMTNLVPGPNAVEMAIHIGFLRAGWPGLVCAGAAFILPAFVISLAFAWLYVQFGALPQGEAVFYGVNPAVIAIVLAATYRLGRSAIKDRATLVIGLAALVAAVLGVNEVVLLLGAGVVGVLVYAAAALRLPALPPTPPLAVWLPFAPVALGWLDERLVALGLFFLKVGALLFGSGLVLFAFIQRDVVEGFGWLTQAQLVDAIAVGQMTPGPVLSSATFIGYLVAGWAGAVVATVAVFLPSFIIVSLLGSLAPRLRRSPAAQAFLRGVNAAVVALILAVSLALFRSAIVDVWTGLILLAALVALLRFRVDTLWLVVGGAVVGLLRFLLV